MSVNDDDILVKPVDGSPELNSSDKFYLSSKKLPDDIKPKAGMKLEITYNGGILETYPAQFGNVQKIVAVKDDTVKNDGILLKGTKDMTLKDVVELAKKGNDLDWTDFSDYNGRDVGSGLYIWEYKLEGGFVLDVGGDIQKKPIYILLSHDNDKGIDIRTEDVKEYIASTATPVIQNTSDNTTKEENFLNIDMYIRQYMNENNIDGYCYFTEGNSSFVIVCKTNEGISQVKAFVKEKGYNADRIEYKLLDLKINAPEKVPEELDGLSSLIVDFMKNNSIGGTSEVYSDVVRVVLDRMNDQNGRTLAYFMEQCGIDKTKVIIDAVTFDYSGGQNDGQTSVKKNLPGDANCDGDVNMSDAVIIMQSLANPAKYGVNGTDENHITEQGKINGDIAGNNDGITNADALAVQKKLLGLDKTDVQSIDSSLIANKVFVYEKSADPGIYDDLCDFSFGSNGIYTYHIGYYTSSNQDQGTWEISGDTLVLTGQYGTNKFRYEDKSLVYIAEGSDGFSDFNDKSTPKDGEKFYLAEEPDYAAINNLPEIVTIKSDYNPIMSDCSGIGIMLEFDSKDYSISLRTDAGHFTTWDISKGSGPIENIGKTYKIGNSGYIFWTPDDINFDADYRNEIVIIGEKDGKSVKLGNIVVTPSNSHTLTAVLK
jgi:hypothetical protein